jgi:hypothetical protein
MKKFFTFSVFFLLHYQLSFSQMKKKYETREINGYYIWEMRYDSLMNEFYSKAIYVITDNNQFSVIGLGPMFTVVKLCNNKNIKANYRRSLQWRKTNPIDIYYHIYRDTSTITSSDYITMNGTFYQNDSGNLYLAYKIQAKALVIDSLCSGFENSQSLRSHCGTPFVRPYIYILKNIQTENIDSKDLEKFNWSVSGLKQIHWIECH